MPTLLGGALLVVVVSMFDTRVWWLDLPSQFRWHAFALFTIVSLVLLAMLVRQLRTVLVGDKRVKGRLRVPWAFTTLASLGFAITGYSLAFADAPGVGFPDVGGGTGEARVRVVHFNLGTRDDGDWRNVIGWLQQQPADVIFLQEARPDFERALDASPLAANVVLRNVRPDSRGTIALVLGKARLIKATLDVKTFALTRRELARVDVEVDDDRCSLLSMHMCRPTNAIEFAKQSYEIEQVGKWFARERIRAVAIGDINCAAYSPRLASVLREHQLRATTTGTWPAPLPSAVSLPIDVLVTDSATAIELEAAGPNLGSDHRPLMVTVRLPS